MICEQTELDIKKIEGISLLHNVKSEGITVFVFVFVFLVFLVAVVVFLVAVAVVVVALCVI